MVINTHDVNHPTTVLTTQLGIPIEYRQNLIAESYTIGDKMDNSTNLKAIMSTYSIWFETDKFNSLLDSIIYFTQKSFNLPSSSLPLELSEAWFAIYKKGHHAIPHHHIPNRYSFVYYLQTDESSSPLIFNKCNLEITPKNDMLIIFPSYLEHSVPDQIGNKDRICVAGNLNWE